MSHEAYGYGEDERPKPPAGHQVKKIVLPSGKTNEVTYSDYADFDQADDGSAQLEPEKADERDLHICYDDESGEGCGSDLVYPTLWQEQEHDEKNWYVECRCPNCERVTEGIYTQDECNIFDDHLEAGTEAVTSDFKRLMAANMAEDIDRFRQAFDADALWPEDFGRIATAREIEIDQLLRTEGGSSDEIDNRRA
jgi:hypothetical protein